MEKEDLYKKLDTIQANLKESYSIKDVDKINYYISELNKLWKKASVEMLNNAGKDGYFKPKN
tara:strand:+ start:263 stop:448 length:186 start_codon:yes stop_codon:yes gene_type:complete